MKVGLVLEGGAMRGIYTAGVLDVFMEENIVVDGVIGVSAGAVHGGSYVSKQQGRNIRYYKKYANDRRFMSIWSLITTGSLVGTKFCYDELPNILDPFDYETFAKSKIPFYATVTNLKTGRAEYIRCKDIRKDMDWLRASASMPFVSKKVFMDGTPYLDGGVSDSIPVSAFRKLGYQRNIVVLTQVKEYEKKAHKMGAETILYRKYPEFLKSIEGRHRVYNEEKKLISRLEARGEVLAIYPSEELHIGRMEKDPDKIQMMYDLGRHDAKNKLKEIRKFIADAAGCKKQENGN